MNNTSLVIGQEIFLIDSGIGVEVGVDVDVSVPLFVMNTTTESINRTMIKVYKKSALRKFRDSYQNIHGYLSLIVCIFGSISNLLNIIVLTRKHMRTPINFILTALAITDMFTLTTYPIMAIYLYIVKKPGCNPPLSKQWVYFIIFHNSFIITCHNIAMWLTVGLAVFRYICIRQRQSAATICTMQRAKLTVLIVYIVSVLFCFPHYLIHDVKDPDGDGPCGYLPTFSAVAEENPIYRRFVLWMLGVTAKILPCILLTLVSALLIITIQKAKKRESRLFNDTHRATESYGSNEYNRTTMMLVAVVLCTIITELPQGILTWISAVDKQFMHKVYYHLKEIVNLVVLINSAVNFILYCSMSQRFRNTFKSLFNTSHLPNLPAFCQRFQKCPHQLEETQNVTFVVNSATATIHTDQSIV